MDSDDNRYEEIIDNNEYSQNYSAMNDIQESSDDDNTQHAKSNQAITDFISRQFAANERMQKIRDHPESEQQKTDNKKSSPSNSPERKHVSDPARTEALYKSSLKKQEEEKNTSKKPEPSTPRISEKSKQLANAKNERQINAIFSGLTRINQTQFDGLMRKFSIKSLDLIESLKEYSKIANTENEETYEEDKENVVYNGTKLKKLMISAANKEGDSKLVKKVQPFVTAALANSISMISPKLKNGTSYNRKPQSSLMSKTTQQKPKPQEQRNETIEKKTVRPRTAMKSGSKYLPDFYEHLEFNEEQSPRYRTRHTYLAEKPKKPWK